MSVIITTGITGCLKKFCADAKVIHIDIDPCEIGKNAGPTIPLVGDAKHIFEDLLVLDENNLKKTETKNGSTWTVAAI